MSADLFPFTFALVEPGRWAGRVHFDAIALEAEPGYVVRMLWWDQDTMPAGARGISFRPPTDWPRERVFDLVDTLNRTLGEIDAAYAGHALRAFGDPRPVRPDLRPQWQAGQPIAAAKPN